MEDMRKKVMDFEAAFENKELEVVLLKVELADLQKVRELEVEGTPGSIHMEFDEEKEEISQDWIRYWLKQSPFCCFVKSHYWILEPIEPFGISSSLSELGYWK